MQIGLLGPVELTVEDKRAHVSPPTARGLLALLAVAAPNALTVDGILAAMWGDRPPARARNQIQVHISRLRRTFERLGQPRHVIETLPGGYRLAEAHLDTDLLRFKATCAEAERQAARGCREWAATALRSALNLWRGPALADVEAPFADECRTMLRERQRLALLLLADLEFSLGRYAVVAPELITRLAEDPYDEGLRLRLMVALYRSGRSVDALAFYQTTRQLFVGDLGIEPGPDLKKAHAAILTGRTVL